MKSKTILMIFAIVLLGAVVAAAAVTKNQDNNSNPEDHECTPEMMEAGNMSENCPTDMMDSGDCENMSGTAMEGCSSMMEEAHENHMAERDHCGNMGDVTGSMMGGNYKAAAL
jgi:hypothetical protein